MPTETLMTAEQLLHNPIPNKRTELVNGRLIVREPTGYPHGRAAARMLIAIGQHVVATKSGEILTAETGFTLRRGPDTVRAPDVAYVSNAQIAGRTLRGFAELAPELVVEVLSPDDRKGEVREKVLDWLAAGSRLVWVLDPERRTGRVHRAEGSESSLTEQDAFDGEDVLPGLRVSLAEVLA